ncbi:MAG: hypothetical protein IT445_10800 [Phycisphaeraceae bacterium]|nr:hypothetical protein [Phycisphaeraceae bacterium]
MSDLQLYWGETHHNTHQFENQIPSLESTLRQGSRHLDFLATAYYTACAEAFQPGGHVFEKSTSNKLVLEDWKPLERLNSEWADVCRCTRECNDDGTFVVFPGYEWQGDGRCGDHNVIGHSENLPLLHVDALEELYSRLSTCKALAIPHHTAYRRGVRGRDWSVCNETITPFTELFSIHGCSESDEELIGLRANPSMGPGVSGGTYQDALERGLHLGAICSTDGWGDLAGQYGRGLMACYSADLTRDSIWESFRARRVYGVTGDRIQIQFTVDDHLMGDIFTAGGKRRIWIAVQGSDAIDRIELLRNNLVIATHCHQGTWSVPQDGRVTKYKLRIEAGWGPRTNQLDVVPKMWKGQLEVAGGKVLSYEPCWVSVDQGIPVINGSSVSFTMTSNSATAGDRFQNANIFELEAATDSHIQITLNNQVESGLLRDFLAGSREMWFRDECVQLLSDRCGIPPCSPERQDIYHHVAYKAKIHKAIPEAGYTAQLVMEDDEPFAGEIHYRVRVEQRNGQRAWSSPIWVRSHESWCKFNCCY